MADSRFITRPVDDDAIRVASGQNLVPVLRTLSDSGGRTNTQKRLLLDLVLRLLVDVLSCQFFLSPAPTVAGRGAFRILSLFN